MRTRLPWSRWLVAELVVLIAMAQAVNGLHGPLDDHLAGSGAHGGIELLAHLALPSAGNDVFGDAVVVGGHAFVSRVAPPCAAAGIHVVSVIDPAMPALVATIALKGSHADGILAGLRLATPGFTGDVLVVPQETCEGKEKKSGGVAIVDVTNPTKPKLLVDNVGETGPKKVAHAVGSVEAWQAGDRTFLALADLEEGDLDIVEITNPKKPQVLASAAPPASSTQPSLNLMRIAASSATVLQVGASWWMIGAFHDAGFAAFDVTDPANPVFLFDTSYDTLDPQLLEATGIALTPEGNARNAAFTQDGMFFFGVDRDLSPYRALFTIESGPRAGGYAAMEVPGAMPLIALPDGKLNGPTVYGGYGCVASSPIPSAASVLPMIAPGEERIVVLQRGPTADPSAPQDACPLAEKIEQATLAGYEGVLIASDHAGASLGAAPDAPAPSDAYGDVATEAPVVTIGHRAMHFLFGDSPSFAYPEAAPTIGQLGEHVNAAPSFDGWGYATLYDAATGAALDTYAPPESHDPAFAFGYGALSARRVASDPIDPVAYTTWGSAGLRVLKIETATGDLNEVGGYLGPSGNDFDSIRTWRQGGESIVLAVDRDWGVFLFRPT